MSALTPPNSVNILTTFLSNGEMGRTLKEHQSDANMSPFQTPLAKAVQIAPDMQHDPAEAASVLEPWMSLCTGPFAIGNF